MKGRPGRAGLRGRRGFFESDPGHLRLACPTPEAMPAALRSRGPRLPGARDALAGARPAEGRGYGKWIRRMVPSWVWPGERAGRPEEDWKRLSHRRSTRK